MRTPRYAVAVAPAGPGQRGVPPRTWDRAFIGPKCGRCGRCGDLDAIGHQHQFPTARGFLQHSNVNWLLKSCLGSQLAP
jgi:hypothetical protein